MQEDDINKYLYEIFGSKKEETKVSNKILDPFESNEDFDEFENQNNLDKIKNIKRNNINKKICSDCNIELFKSPRGLECDNCGKIEFELEIETEGSSDISNSYNTSESSAAPIRISGPNSYLYQKHLIGNTSVYRKTQRKNTSDQINGYVYQYKDSVPPKYIIDKVIELYCNIQKYCIKRGDVRKGTMAAVAYKLCKVYNIDRKPKEISLIFGIEQSELSNGEKIVDELISSGVIFIKNDDITGNNNLSINDDNDNKKINAFINRYFEVLKIPIDNEDDIPVDRPNYKQFVIRLIRFTQKYKIADDSIISSKCAGAIFIMASRRKELSISIDQMNKECKISKSTFIRFAKSITDILESDVKNKIQSRLKKIFKTHHMLIS